MFFGFMGVMGGEKVFSFFGRCRLIVPVRMVGK